MTTYMIFFFKSKSESLLLSRLFFCRVIVSYSKNTALVSARPSSFVIVCQKLSGLHACSRLPAELTKAGVNICLECPDEDGPDRETRGG